MFIMPVVAFYMIRDWDRLVAHIDGLLPLHSADTIRSLAREIDARLSGFVRGQTHRLPAARRLVRHRADHRWPRFRAAARHRRGDAVDHSLPRQHRRADYQPAAGGRAVRQLGVGGAGGRRCSCPARCWRATSISPKIVGDRVGLHPVWLLFAVTAGAVLLGITGALLAVPTAAAVGVLVRYGVQRYRNSALYADPKLADPNVMDVLPPNPQPPVPESEETPPADPRRDAAPS